jgi:hypothetical protein
LRFASRFPDFLMSYCNNAKTLEFATQRSTIRVAIKEINALNPQRCFEGRRNNGEMGMAAGVYGLQHGERGMSGLVTGQGR